MDEFNPGQSIQMQSAWETYRHKLDYSEAWYLAEDGITCTQTVAPTTEAPSDSPVHAPSASPSLSAKPSVHPSASSDPSASPSAIPSSTPTACTLADEIGRAHV